MIAVSQHSVVFNPGTCYCTQNIFPYLFCQYSFCRITYIFVVVSFDFDLNFDFVMKNGQLVKHKLLAIFNFPELKNVYIELRSISWKMSVLSEKDG